MDDAPTPRRRRAEREARAALGGPVTGGGQATDALPSTEATVPPPSTEAAASRPAPKLPAWRVRLYRLPVLGAIAYLIAPPRTRPPSVLRRAVSVSSGLVAVLGLGMLFYPIAGTHYPAPLRVPVEKGIEWSNVLSDLEHNRIQVRLKGAFAKQTIVAAQGEGEPFTRLEIPKLRVDTIVVEGTSPSALKAGAGHYPQTPLPGQPGNVAIAGHRTTYGRPFNRIDEMRTGDQIVLTTPVGRFTYEMSRDPFVTTPTDWSVVDQPSGEAWLTLTSCHPKGSANQRLVVRAKLVRSEPAQRPRAA